MCIRDRGWTDAGYYYCEAYNAYETVLSPATEIIVEDNALGGNMPAAAISLATVLIALFLGIAGRRHTPTKPTDVAQPSSET